MNIKNISLTTLALSAAIFAANSQAADDTAAAGAVVIAPIAVAQATDLSFGNFARGLGGTVTISNSGVRSNSGTILSAINDTAPGAASFSVTGDGDSTYSISFSGTSANLTDGGAGVTHNMALATTSDLTGGNVTSGNASSGTLSAGGAQSIYVGGTLTVNAAQVAGSYTGLVSVTVEYN